jgi:hypothetical protein
MCEWEVLKILPGRDDLLDNLGVNSLRSLLQDEYGPFAIAYYLYLISMQVPCEGHHLAARHGFLGFASVLP